jgi:hypothetical protein
MFNFWVSDPEHETQSQEMLPFMLKFHSIKSWVVWDGFLTLLVPLNFERRVELPKMQYIWRIRASYTAIATKAI